MSDAGAYSDRGDDYQRAIALKLIMQMLESNDISSIEIQATSLASNNTEITIDDIVVFYAHGKTNYIQCKRNQKDWRAWQTSDQTIKDELKKAKTQLRNDLKGVVTFLSESEFGKLKKLTEYISLRPDYQAFITGASQAVKNTIKEVSSIWNESDQTTFDLLKRVEFSRTDSYQDILQNTQSHLRRTFSGQETIVSVLLHFISEMSSKSLNVPHRFNAADVKRFLSSKGIHQAPEYNQQELVNEFQRASLIGRYWIREIDGKRIRRKSLDILLGLIASKTKTILLTDDPGSGKTCLLLDLIEHLESSSGTFLFIKADNFATCSTFDDLTSKGLPENLLGKIARLADQQHVAVVIDSLDVVSLNRANGSLHLFLTLLDQLEGIPNVTSITACREFDRKYDQNLKARQWKETVHIGSLDWDSEIKPFLEDWGIDISSFNNDMKLLLSNPRKLKIFEELAKRGQANTFESEQALVQRYLEVVVLEDPGLGIEALKGLQSFASKLLLQHGQWLPISTLNIPDAIRQKLLSSEILVTDPHTGCIGFAHQTLVEGLSIQEALSNNKTLVTFLKERPPLPTLRPVVRAFFFYLRTFQKSTFRKQIREVFDDRDIAFHLKRLLAESLAEIAPTSEDFGIVRHLHNNHPELFNRFLWSTQHSQWLFFLKEHWLPIVKLDISKQLGNEFAGLIERWINACPDEVIALWNDAIKHQWCEDSWARMRLPISLDKLENWHVPGIKDLMEHFLKTEQKEHDYLGRVLGKWVEATNQHFDLLWSYIVSEVDADGPYYYKLNGDLRCEPHTFCREGFLQELMLKSCELLELSIASLELWSATIAKASGAERALFNGFLHETSWHVSHSDYDIHHIQASNILMKAIESAIEEHAKLNTTWWQQNSRRLATSHEAALRYFFIKASTIYPLHNIESISLLILDSDIYHCSLSHEVGELMTSAYYLLNADTQEKHQEIIFQEYMEGNIEAELSTYAIKAICAYLDRIPTIYRTDRACQFLDAHAKKLPVPDRSPYITSAGGWVGSPIDKDVLCRFTDEGLLALFSHYKKVGDLHLETYQGRLIGGEDQISSIVSEASAIFPARFSRLLSHSWHDIPVGFRESIFYGLSNYLRYESGKLQSPQGWSSIEEPDSHTLALDLLSLLENKTDFSILNSYYADVLVACAAWLIKDSEVNRFAFLCHDALRLRASDLPKANDEKELLFKGINSSLGKVAEALIGLANKLLESDHELSVMLVPLISAFIKLENDPINCVLLRYLPYLQYKKSELGWRFFEQIMHTASASCWQHAEKCLYYGYRNNFSIVNAYLTKIAQHSMGEAGQTWGRIATLSYLSDHITQEKLFDQLITACNKDAWLGATQVFSSNIQISECYLKCLNGLSDILISAPTTSEIILEAGKIFNADSTFNLPIQLVQTYFEKLAQVDGRHDPYHFIEWNLALSINNPSAGLEASEALCTFLEKRHCQLWHTETVAMLLTTLFREGEDSNDLDLIKRVVSVQEVLFKYSSYGLEEWLKLAEK